jgi:endonuclease YncB( thermonuclease family)
VSIPAPYVYNAWVVSVHDGDTLNVVVDRGMYEYAGNERKPIPVRVAGGAARELADPGGVEARDAVAALLPAGTPLVLATVKPDKYGPRWLAHVTFPMGGYETDLATYLIRLDWLAPWDGRGPQPRPPWPRLGVAQ